MSKDRDIRRGIELKTGRPASAGASWKEATQTAAEKLEKQKQLTTAYQVVLNSPEGRIVLKDLLQLCMTFETTMTGNSYTYFNEGKRSIGLHILNKIQSNLIHKILEDENA